FQQASLTYSFSDIDYHQELITYADEGNPVPVSADYAYKSSSIRPMWMRNTLDSRFEPTRGLMMTGSLEVAGSILGGDTDFVRPRFTVTWFRPISRQPVKSSFGINLEGGLISEFGERSLFTQQLFFLGGGNSVRGFRTRTIMVRDEDGNILYDTAGFPLGGHKMLQLNLEYHVLLSGPFRVVFFGDAGGVFGKDQSVDPGLMRYSAGAELRITVPMFPAPLRFIYASNLEPLPNDRFETFDFSLTTSF
ncbi:MAG: BamA/TamA family outer membrane protein, partial [bacterium]|nr:BamA/TamA family outer membrane protein [bacterium]